MELELSACTYTDHYYDINYTGSTVIVLEFVGSCLATKVFIGNLPAMGRGWIIIK